MEITSHPKVAVYVSRRPEWWEHGLESAHRIADIVVSRFHDAGEFADVFNDALEEASEHAPVCVKVDDHDFYPSDHAHIIDLWRPESTVWGWCRQETCTGIRLPEVECLCASAIPTTITVTPDQHGRIYRSVLGQTRRLHTATGVVKRVCVGEWSWGVQPKVDCGGNHDTIV